MIELYHRETCPYCAKVRAVIDELDLDVMYHDIGDDAKAGELIALGGKQQVPFLVDGDVQMYESDDIIGYLRNTYGS